MYEEIPEIPEYLELGEFPTQGAVQTPAILLTNVMGATEKDTTNPKRSNGLKEVNGSEDLDDGKYLTMSRFHRQ